METPTQVKRFDELTIVALAFLIFLAINALKDQPWLAGWFDPPAEPQTAAAEAAPVNAADSAALIPQAAAPAVGGDPAVAPWTGKASYDPALIVFPYEHFTLTQGPHGEEYGHIAIDIASGKNATILAPINGVITASYVDEYGNTNLILENERYTVTLLHGNFSAKVGEFFNLGQTIGKESNNGYTLDAYGQPCAGRDCGYHSHMNVFDKQTQANVNPLEILKPIQQTTDN